METRGKIDASMLNLNEKLVNINRVAKVVKGGKRLRFTALVVVGDGEGHVGMGVGKAQEVPEAIRKAGVQGRKRLIKVPMRGTTIPHETLVKYEAAKILMKPAAPGTGVKAAGGVRAVMEAVGIRDILTKSLGNSNPINIVKATMLGLAGLKDIRAEVARRKGYPEGDQQEKKAEENEQAADNLG